MNKTVTINLANIFFHIDEEAYAILQNYLNAIKKSFSNSEGKEEIIADIEARIAELFSEKLTDSKQVITTADVERMMGIMGQPEDYHIDEDLFEEPANETYTTSSAYTGTERTVKKLYRDMQSAYIGGVCSGLGHYLGIDPVWLRLILVLLTIGSTGAFILIYIIFWIVVPEAKTTSERLSMKGEPINISSIEQKIKEGVDSVKNADYGSLQRGTSSAVHTLGKIATALLAVFIKLVGAVLILISSAIVISLGISLFTALVMGSIEGPWFIPIHTDLGPNGLWIPIVLCLFFIGVPCFFLFMLGLSILFSTVRSVGKPVKLVLLGVWILSFFGLIAWGLYLSTRNREEAFINQPRQNVQMQLSDTLRIRMNPYEERYGLESGKRYTTIHTDDGTKLLALDRVRFAVLPSKTNEAYVEIQKTSKGNSYEEAKRKAQNITYNYTIDGRIVQLSGYGTVPHDDFYSKQKVRVNIYVPDSTVFILSDISNRYLASGSGMGRLRNKNGEFLYYANGTLECDSCPEYSDDGEDVWEYKFDDLDDDSDFDFNADDDGLNIRLENDDKSFELDIDEDGIHINNEPVNVEIDEDGVKIKKQKS